VFSFAQALRDGAYLDLKTYCLANLELPAPASPLKPGDCRGARNNLVSYALNTIWHIFWFWAGRTGVRPLRSFRAGVLLKPLTEALMELILIIVVVVLLFGGGGYWGRGRGYW
jgi:hypothetical protein